jgi:hypothetical protein
MIAGAALQIPEYVGQSESTKQEVLVIDPKNVSNLYFHNNIVNDTTAVNSCGRSCGLTVNACVQVITSAERRHWLTSFDSGETAYVYDSPGTINEDSILQHLTLDELIRLVPRRVLQPRTTTLRMGQSLLVGGVARIEIPYEREVIGERRACVCARTQSTNAHKSLTMVKRRCDRCR